MSSSLVVNENVRTAVLFELALHFKQPLCLLKYKHTLTIGWNQRSQALKMEAKLSFSSTFGMSKICDGGRLGLGRGLQASLWSGDL